MGQQALAAGVTFAEPKLFANSLLRGDDNDPREDLTTLFGGSFSMEEEERKDGDEVWDGENGGGGRGGGWFGGWGGVGKNNNNDNDNDNNNNRKKRKNKKKN